MASTGASWGEGLRAAFDGPKFEEKNKTMTQEFAIDSVFTAKGWRVAAAVLDPRGVAGRANFWRPAPPANSDLNIVTITTMPSTAPERRGQLKNRFAPFVLIVMGLVYNTKEA